MLEKEQTNVQEAVKYLVRHLATDGAAYNEPTPQLYVTTITLIIIIHIIFVWQLKQKKTKRHVVTSYDQIVRRKKFHKLLFWAILSHPSPNDVSTTATIATAVGFASNDDQGGGSVLPFWSGAPHLEGQDSAHSRLWNWRILHQNGSTCATAIIGQLYSFGMIVASRIQYQIIRPLCYGPLAGLPLLTYIAHIMWQCRALEEVYDYRTDSANYIMNNFNVSSIIQNDLIVRDSIMQTNYSSTLNNNSTNSKMEGKLSSDTYDFQYYRVLLVLTLMSYLTDFLMTYLSLRYIKSRHQQHGQQLIQYPYQQNNITPAQNNIIEFLSQRGVCSLTPLCAAVLVLYVHHFPSTPISVLPFISISYVFGSSPDLSFIACIIILTVLSYRTYPLMSIIYGCTSGLLWTLGWTQFLADRYWGCASIIVVGVLCAMSFKVELMSSDERNHSATRNAWRGLLSWLDYVCWDVDGVIRL